ncbi:MAG: AMP-binding protein [Gammaproteobacteria bacterium]|nr:AMP-binding protein [Gammaproteobacteria bacterium]
MNSSMMVDQCPMSWVGDWAGRRAALTPDRLALIDAQSGTHWRYKDLNQAANRLAQHLLSDGLQQGDVIALIDGNTVASVLLFLACGKLGLVVAPVSYRLAPTEMGALLARIKPQTTISAPAYAEHLEQAGLENIVLTSELLAAIDSEKPAADCNRPLSMDAECLYVHTGGSTGLPKICVVTHRQMIWNAIELLVSAPEGLANRRELLLFPLFHIGGWNTLLPVLYGGGCVVIHNGFEPQTVLELVSRYQINHFGAVEAMLKAIAGVSGFADYDLSSLKGITTAGAPCSAAAMAPFFSRGIPIRQAYGLTEAGPSNCFNGNEGATLSDLEAQADSIGTGFFHCDHQIVEPATGYVLPAGEIGELWLRSPHAFAGYLGDPEATSERQTDDGWVRSGDLAWEDECGQLRVVGRLDNVIVSGGENISAEEIETALCAHPLVSSALVFGVADQRWGETPVAQITVSEVVDIAAIRAYLVERLAGFKQPGVIQIVDSLPRTGTGKLDRPTAKSNYKDKA